MMCKKMPMSPIEMRTRVRKCAGRAIMHSLHTSDVVTAGMVLFPPTKYMDFAARARCWV